MIQVDADILLIDEVLAVGDISFQHKCHEALDDIRKRGRTILFVTHDMPTIEVKCDRALLLDHGEMVVQGDPQLVSRQYDSLNFSRQADVKGDDTLRRGDGSAEVLDAWAEDEHGQRSATIERGRPCVLRVTAELKRDAEDPIVGLTIGTEHVPHLFRTTTDSNGPTGSFSAGERLELIVELQLPVAPGRYSLSPFVSDSGGGRPFKDQRQGLASITITGNRADQSLIALDHHVRLERGAAVR
jgi:hypothetical protein